MKIKRILLYSFGIIIFILLGGSIFYFGYFLRQPHRNIPHDQTVFVSPANGKIIRIIQISGQEQELLSIEKNHKKVLDTFITDVGKNVTIVSIAMGLGNVHWQRAPQNAKVINQTYKPGKFLNAIKTATMRNATIENEHNAILFETTEGTRFKIIQIAGKLARRIVSYIKVNDNVKQGEIIGLIKLGSQVTIIFDDTVEILAQEGQMVIDGETILARKKPEKYNKHERK